MDILLIKRDTGALVRLNLMAVVDKKGTHSMEDRVI